MVAWVWRSDVLKILSVRVLGRDHAAVKRERPSLFAYKDDGDVVSDKRALLLCQLGDSLFV